jgi:hypothetical protein
MCYDTIVTFRKVPHISQRLSVAFELQLIIFSELCRTLSHRETAGLTLSMLPFGNVNVTVTMKLRGNRAVA